MDWSCEDVIRWAIANLKADETVIARLRGKFFRFGIMNG